ncbi:ABC transporter substrate-binding protein [Glaciihabitans sp. UYNi722]|uniref:ABC transporter substrate-binding protein n=1 Tax=Glaciihabitans sp. UYNi722 TaxID=3156344 RepID=UPI003396220D
MKSRTRLGTAIAAVAASALLLAGCAAASAPATSSGPQKVVMWGSWGGDQVKQIDQMTSKFNASQSKYVVNYVPQELVEQKLLTAVAGGQVPDLVMWDRYQTALYAPKGALQSIDERVTKDNVNLKAFYPQALGEMKSGGKLYGLPTLVDNRSLVYNKKMFADHGLTPPTTWAELKTDAEKLTLTSGGKLQTSGFLLSDPGLFAMYLAEAGGQLVNKAGTKTAFNSPQGLDVLNFWKSLTDAGVYTQGFGDGTNAFAAGNAAMQMDGPWDIPSLDQVTSLSYGVAEPPVGPSGDKGATMGGFGLVIPQGAKQSDGAWAFMKWWATEPKNGVAFSKISSWLPANRDAAKDPYFSQNANLAAFVKTLDYAKVRPSVAGYSDVEGKALTPALQKFMSGELTASQALSQAQVQGDQILQENKK